MPVLIPLEKKIRFYVFLSNELLCCIILCRRQFYAIAIFLMGRLDTYGVGQKLWGVAASLLARLHPIASGPLLY